MLVQVDDHLGSISESLSQAFDRPDELRADAVPARELTWDGLVGDRTPLGYQAELEREVSRARTAERPLSLIVLDVHALAGFGDVERVARELLTLLERVTRTSDRVVRRGDDEIVVLLPDTTAEAAWRFHGRLRVELEQIFDRPGEKLTVLTDVVEWRPSETSTSLDERARQAVARAGPVPLGRQTDGLDLPSAG